MTVQYNGNDYYDVHLVNRTLILSQDEINEIQGWNFPNNSEILKDEEELEEELEELKEKNLSIAENLDELISDIEENVNDTMFQKDEFLSDVQSTVSQITALKWLND